MKNSISGKENFDKKSEELFSKLQISWDISKDEVWNDISRKLVQPKVIKMQNKKSSYVWAVAASLLLLLATGFFMRVHTRTINAPAGKHLMAQLPDGSKIYLNADAQISYHPYWWKINRTVDLKGEAFFEVEKGKTFSVHSATGTTKVLGTSFNIYARNHRYEVTCITGKVKVLDNKTGKSVQITPGEKVKVQKNGTLKVEKNVDTDNVRAWMLNRFVFTASPIIEVFKEIERQYNVEIIVPEKIDLQYTGSFEKTETIEETLYFICRPLNLKVKKQSKKRFIISKKQ
jgi:ferric-dicitrate binding protein FerR (iron transport regulator)